MFCSKCGNEVDNEAVICPNCGCPLKEMQPMTQSNTNAPMIQNGETPGLATGALVCAFLFPLIGLILGIAGAVKYKTPNLKSRCVIAIVLSIVVWAVTAVILYVGM